MGEPLQRRQEGGESAGREHGVRIEDEEMPPTSGRYAHVAAGGEAPGVRVGDQRRVAVASHDLRRAVGRRVVDYDDLDHEVGRCRRDRGQTGLDDASRVVGDDDDGEVDAARGGGVMRPVVASGPIAPTGDSLRRC